MGRKSQLELKPEHFNLPAGSTISILPTETEEALDELIDSLNTQFHPQGDAEQFLVDQMVHARWKILRFRRLEGEALDRVMENEFGSPHADRRLLNAIDTPGSVFQILERYIASAERAYSKAVRDLTQLRTNAAKSEKQNKAKAADLWLQGELANIESEIPRDAFDPTYAPRVQNEPTAFDRRYPEGPISPAEPLGDVDDVA